jgi:hypothetical protein
MRRQGPVADSLNTVMKFRVLAPQLGLYRIIIQGNVTCKILTEWKWVENDQEWQHCVK